MKTESLNRINEIRRLSNSNSQEDICRKWELVREESIWIKNQILKKSNFKFRNYLITKSDIGSLIKQQIDANTLIDNIIK